MSKQPSIRSLCGRCKSDYENSGYKLSKVRYQEFKDDCDICHVRKGWEYEVTQEDERSGYAGRCK